MEPIQADAGDGGPAGQYAAQTPGAMGADPESSNGIISSSGGPLVRVDGTSNVRA